MAENSLAHSNRWTLRNLNQHKGTISSHQPGAGTISDSIQKRTVHIYRFHVSPLFTRLHKTQNSVISFLTGRKTPAAYFTPITDYYLRIITACSAHLVSTFFFLENFPSQSNSATQTVGVNRDLPNRLSGLGDNHTQVSLHYGRVRARYFPRSIEGRRKFKLGTIYFNPLTLLHVPNNEYIRPRDVNRSHTHKARNQVNLQSIKAEVKEGGQDGTKALKI